jgi:hypothetical protein
MRPYLPALLSDNNMERNKVVDWAVQSNLVGFGRLEFIGPKGVRWFEVKAICANAGGALVGETDG